jgi:hypothetical protein
LAVHCVRCTVRVVSWFIVHSLGVTLHVVHPAWCLVRAVARLGEVVRTQSSHTDSIVAPVVPTVGNRGDAGTDAAANIASYRSLGQASERGSARTLASVVGTV